MKIGHPVEQKSNGLSSINEVDWHFATENYNDDFLTDIYLLRQATSYLYEGAKQKHSLVLAVYKKNHSKFYFSKTESIAVSQEAINKFIYDQAWRAKIETKVNYSMDKLWHVYDNFPNLSQCKLEDLYKLYLKQEIPKNALIHNAWIYEEMHTRVNSIDKQLKHLLDKYDIGHCFSSLLYSDKLSAYSEEKKLLQSMLDSYDEKLLVRLCAIFSYSAYHGYTNRKIKNSSDYLKEIEEHKKSGEPFYTPNDEQKHQYEKICSKYNIPDTILSLFRDYTNIGITKSYRRLVELKNFYYTDLILNEISQRVDLDESILRFMAPNELIEPKKHIKEAIERSKNMVFYINNGEETVLTNVEVPLEDLKIDFVNGMCACPGYRKGVAKVITDECMEIQLGDIIVTNEPNPELFDIIKNCAAIVTDQGGITCHVASIARELNIPCVVGCQAATNKIHTGDIVEVDANTGTVRILCNE